MSQPANPAPVGCFICDGAIPAVQLIGKYAYSAGEIEINDGYSGLFGVRSHPASNPVNQPQRQSTHIALIAAPSRRLQRTASLN
ncbi:MAG: hypothetical protein L0Y58_04550 [Verrucomicrobia subdivision 3 bacterium]|nr:hypothetical protein [Limisphaerales bacterium]